MWVLVVISFYYLFGKSFAGYLGFDLAKDNETVIGLGYFITPDFIWFYIYYIVATLLFYFFWSYYFPHKWERWSILGSSLLILMAYLTVQVSVVINAWYGPFYNDVQNDHNAVKAILFMLIFIAATVIVLKRYANYFIFLNFIFWSILSIYNFFLR